MASDQEGELGHIFTVVTVAETRLLLALTVLLPLI